MPRLHIKSLIAACALALCSSGAYAQEKIKVALGHGVTYDTAFPIAAAKAGVYKKHGLDVEFMPTNGSGETLQAVISGSVDLGLAVGLTGIMGAFTKGAPLRVITAEGTTMNECFLYAKADSPLKSLADADGKVFAISTVGASTNQLVAALTEHYKVKPGKIVATGSVAPTYAAVMSGQVDLGWGCTPFGLEEERAGKIRILSFGIVSDRLRNQTQRVNITTARVLDERKDVIKKFIAAHYDAVNWAYESEEALKIVGENQKVAPATVEEARTKYSTRETTQLAEIKGIEQTMKDATEFRYIPAPLTPEQLKTLIQVDALKPAGK